MHVGELASVIVATTISTVELVDPMKLLETHDVVEENLNPSVVLHFELHALDNPQDSCIS